MGNVIGFLLSGWLSDSNFGWPVVFYLYGVVGVTWAFIWYLVGSDSPAKHKSISSDERKYIEAGIEGDADKEV